LALFGHNGLQPLLALPTSVVVVGQVHHANAVLPEGGQKEAGLRTRLQQETVRHLEKDAGAIPRIGFAPAGSPVTQVEKDRQRLADYLVGLDPLDVGDEPDAARIVFELGIVQPLLARHSDWLVGNICTHGWVPP
jgi:hypothetical protein